MHQDTKSRLQMAQKFIGCQTNKHAAPQVFPETLTFEYLSILEEKKSTFSMTTSYGDAS